jgi:uncharacterized membrane protein YtjA (UPF0391 family)
MIYYALAFLIVALISAVLGFSGISGTAANVAWILFVVGLVLAIVFFVRGEGPPFEPECGVCKSRRKAREAQARVRKCGTCNEPL